MQSSLVVSALGLCVLLGCASGPPVPAGMKVGEFVPFECEGGKRFSARVAEGGQSIRVRSDGGFELDHKSNGVYEGSGWRLVAEAGVASLFHEGKQTHKACRPA
jgi:hypothetical protein